jgi:hypothetical protein
MALMRVRDALCVQLESLEELLVNGLLVAVRFWRLDIRRQAAS